MFTKPSKPTRKNQSYWEVFAVQLVFFFLSSISLSLSVCVCVCVKYVTFYWIAIYQLYWHPEWAKPTNLADNTILFSSYFISFFSDSFSQMREKLSVCECSRARSIACGEQTIFTYKYMPASFIYFSSIVYD